MPMRRNWLRRSRSKACCCLLRIVRVCAIADAVDGLQDVAELYPGVVPADACPVGGIVDLYVQYARQLCHVPFIQPDAGSAGDTFQDQCGFPLMFAALRTNVF